MSELIRVPIEIDVTYVNKHWPSKRAQPKEKHYVLGMFQRGFGEAKSIAIIKALEDNKAFTIADCISENIAGGATLYVEENILPSFLQEFYDIHELKESDGHSKGDLHVNNVKNMWRDLKRQIKREHVSVSKEHLQGYCDEVSWRLNNNHLSSMEKFDLLIKAASNKRVTYKDLIKKKSANVSCK